MNGNTFWSKPAFLFGLAFALFTTTATAAPVSDQERLASFDLRQAPALLEQFSDPEKALAQDLKAALQFWDGFLTANNVRYLYSQNSCGLQIESDYDSPSGIKFSLRLSRAPDCERTDSYARADVTLRSSEEADTLRHALKQRFGPSDPKCSNEKSAFWRLHPGYTLHWQEDYANMPQITLLNVDPTDANCSVNSVIENRLIDEAQVTAFLTHLKEVPSLLTDPQAMESWLSAYGPVNRSQNDKCLVDFYIRPNQSNFRGVYFISATAVVPECRNDPSAVKRGNLFLSITGGDMFAETKFRNVLNAVYGKRFMPCAEEIREIWKLSDNAIIDLVRDMRPPGPIIMALTIPPDTLECMRE